MPKHKKRTWEDHAQLLEYLIDHEIKDAATYFRISNDAVRSWLATIRKQLDQTQASLNKIRNLQRISKRVRKLTLSKEIKEEEQVDAEDTVGV